MGDFTVADKGIEKDKTDESNLVFFFNFCLLSSCGGMHTIKYIISRKTKRGIGIRRLKSYGREKGGAILNVIGYKAIRGKEFVPDEKEPHFATWKKNTIFNPNCRQIIEKDVVKWFR